jgi:hypothetical protein
MFLKSKTKIGNWSYINVNMSIEIDKMISKQGTIHDPERVNVEVDDRTQQHLSLM